MGLKLDDPNFTAPIYANLFDDEEGKAMTEELHAKVDALESEMNDLSDSIDALSVVSAIQVFADFVDLDPIAAVKRIIANTDSRHGEDSVIREFIELSQSEETATAAPKILRILEIDEELSNTEF